MMTIIGEIIFFTLIFSGLANMSIRKIKKTPNQYFQIHFRFFIIKTGIYLLSTILFMAAVPHQKTALILTGLAVFFTSHVLEGFLVQRQLQK